MGFNILVETKQKARKVVLNIENEFIMFSRRQYADLVLPINFTCNSCSIRLLRQALEWGPFYLFWSCADVTIIRHPNVTSASCATNTRHNQREVNGKPEPESESEPESTGEPEPSLQPEPSGKPEPKGEPEPESNGEPEPSSQPEPSGEPEPSSLPEPKAEPESNTSSDLSSSSTSSGTCLPNVALALDGCYDGKCLNGGTCNGSTGACSCPRLFSGDRCEEYGESLHSGGYTRLFAIP